MNAQEEMTTNLTKRTETSPRVRKVAQKLALFGILGIGSAAALTAPAPAPASASEPSRYKLDKCVGYALNNNGGVVTQEMVDIYIDEGYDWTYAKRLADFWDIDECVAVGFVGAESIVESSIS